MRTLKDHVLMLLVLPFIAVLYLYDIARYAWWQMKKKFLDEG